MFPERGLKEEDNPLFCIGEFAEIDDKRYAGIYGRRFRVQNIAYKEWLDLSTTAYSEHRYWKYKLPVANKEGNFWWDSWQLGKPDKDEPCEWVDTLFKPSPDFKAPFQKGEQSGQDS